MPAKDDIIYNQKLLTMYRDLLSEFLRQHEQWSYAETPEFLSRNIVEARRNIMNIKGTLRSWSVTVNDQPNDQDNKEDLMPEIIHQSQLLKIYRKNLPLYLNQKEQFAENQVPPHIINSIHKARTEIQRIKAILRGWNIPVEDLPGEKEDN
jgi:hypothetical protein